MSAGGVICEGGAGLCALLMDVVSRLFVGWQLFQCSMGCTCKQEKRLGFGGFTVRHRSSAELSCSNGPSGMPFAD